MHIVDFLNLLFFHVMPVKAHGALVLVGERLVVLVGQHVVDLELDCVALAPRGAGAGNSGGRHGGRDHAAAEALAVGLSNSDARTNRFFMSLTHASVSIF
jgi:hypothetical protein